jgi:hypothetical protein
MSRVMVAAVLAGACASPVAQAPPGAAGQPAPNAGALPGPGPALGIYPPNATRVTARVLRRAVYAAESLPPRPYVPPGTTLYALTIEIQDARQARPDVAMGPAVGTIEAFSRDPLPADLVGQRIEATVTLAGDTRASRWLISDIRPLP